MPSVPPVDDRDVHVYIDSPFVRYLRNASEDALEYIQTEYIYERSCVTKLDNGKLHIKPCKEEYVIQTDVKSKPKRYDQRDSFFVSLFFFGVRCLSVCVCVCVW